jgi:hypothetical protein
MRKEQAFRSIIGVAVLLSVCFFAACTRPASQEKECTSEGKSATDKKSQGEYLLWESLGKRFLSMNNR